MKRIDRDILKENGGHMPGTIGAVLAARDDWETPRDLFDVYHRDVDYTLDPCANFNNCVVAWYFDKEQDGLAMRWRDVHGAPARVWLHPPHSQAHLWARKAVIESQKGVHIDALLPAKTGDGWWHEFVLRYAASIRYLRGTPAFRLRRLPITQHDRVDAAPSPFENTKGRPLPVGGFAIVTYRSR